MFRVKICGITNPKDAQEAVNAGADAIGLNFYHASDRYVDLATAEEIVRVVPDTVSVVGVFVNAAVDAMNATADQLRLDYLQLHGDEPADRLVELSPHKIIRAFRFREQDIGEIGEYLAVAQQLGVAPSAVLVDTCHVGAYGGTGEVGDWEGIRRLAGSLGGAHLVLAGGLGPENVREAVARVRPSAVDVASGVEANPRQKDVQRMRQFISAALEALASNRGGGA